MPINSETAAKVGRKYRLTLADTRALAKMADTEEAADQLAADFSDNMDPGQLAERVMQRGNVGGSTIA